MLARCDAPFWLCIFFFFFAKKWFEKRSICASHRAKTFFLLQHLFSSLQWQPMFTTRSSIFCGFPAPPGKVTPPLRHNLTSSHIFFLSLSKADWSWNPQGLQETFSEQDLWVEVWGNAAAVRGSYRSSSRLFVVGKSSWHHAKFQSWLRSCLLNKGSTRKNNSHLQVWRNHDHNKEKDFFIHTHFCVQAAGFPPLHNLLVRAAALLHVLWLWRCAPQRHSGAAPQDRALSPFLMYAAASGAVRVRFRKRWDQEQRYGSDRFRKN